jgi:hypothetical protein
MAELRIKGESLPARCEVCHQADCFDAEANLCSRCESISSNLTSQLNKNEDWLERILGRFFNAVGNGLVWMLLGTCIGVVLVRATDRVIPDLISPNAYSIFLFGLIVIGATVGITIGTRKNNFRCRLFFRVIFITVVTLMLTFGYYIGRPLIFYFYLVIEFESIPKQGLRSDINRQLWLFRSHSSPLPEAAKKSFSSETKVVTYSFILMPELEITAIYDENDWLLMKRDDYE